MKSPQPRVSVGMPVYNGEPFLAMAIESVLTQSFTSFELIISDNASCDGTEDLCRHFAARDKRIRYYRNERNFGAARNYNRVFQLSSGHYFKWATADDVCDSHYLERCVEVLDRRPDVILCYGKTKLIDETGQIIATYEDGLNLSSKSAAGRFLQLKYNLGMCNALCGVIRSRALRRTRLIGSYIGSDQCLLAELSFMGCFYELPEYLFFRRVHPGSSSARRDEDSQLEFFDPGLKGRTVMRRWRHLYENLLAVHRAPVRMSQKVMPAIFLLGTVAINHRAYARELLTAIRKAGGRGNRRGEAERGAWPIEDVGGRTGCQQSGCADTRLDDQQRSCLAVPGDVCTALGTSDRLR